MPLGQFKTFDECKKHYISKGKSDKEAGAICGAIEKNIKESTSKNQDGIVMVSTYQIKPTPINPKFSQDYAWYLPQSMCSKSCSGCMHFIQGTGDEDNSCQLIKSIPNRILPEGYCRLHRPLSDLEGYIPAYIEEDDSLPIEVKSLMGDKDVEDETTE